MQKLRLFPGTCRAKASFSAFGTVFENEILNYVFRTQKIQFDEETRLKIAISGTNNSNCNKEWFDFISSLDADRAVIAWKHGKRLQVIRITCFPKRN